MKRFALAAGAFAAALAMLLAGCTDPGSRQGAPPLTIFAAASLQGAFDDLLEEFAAQHPDISIAPPVYDGSSTLVTQLEEGAAADVLATADEPTMERASMNDLLTSDPQVFASNDLIIAVPSNNPHGIEDLPDVLALEYAVCAAGVPCGDATARLFEAAGVQPEPVSEEQNVTAVANRVLAGEVDAGFVYSTDVAARPELTGVSPQAARIVNHYPLATTSDSAAATAFVAYVLSREGQEILTDHGFGQP